MDGQMSLLENARLDDPTRSDIEHMEQIATDIIRELREEPPVDLKVVASYRGISRIKLAQIPMAGCLAPNERGIVMVLNRDHSPRRQRFTGFHEIGHSFQPGYRTRRSYRCTPLAMPRASADPEALCDAAAASLLFPRDNFEADVVECDFGMQGILGLAERYDASIQATMYQFQRYWPEPVLTLVLEPGVRKSEIGKPEVEPRLRVVSAHATGAWTGPYIPRNKSVRDGGMLWRALQGEAVDTTANLDEFGADWNLDVHLSARSVRYWANNEPHQRVLAIIRPRIKHAARWPAPSLIT